MPQSTVCTKISDSYAKAALLLPRTANTPGFLPGRSSQADTAGRPPAGVSLQHYLPCRSFDFQRACVWLALESRLELAGLGKKASRRRVETRGPHQAHMPGVLLALNMWCRWKSSVLAKPRNTAKLAPCWQHAWMRCPLKPRACTALPIEHCRGMSSALLQQGCQTEHWNHKIRLAA